MLAGVLASTLAALPAAHAAVEVPAPGSETTPAAPAAPAPGAEQAPGTVPAQVPSPTAVEPAPVRLTVGSRGRMVRDLQRELRRRGARIKVDGVFGTSTARAVRWFQKRNHLPVTGVADARLIARLGLQTLSVASGAVVTPTVLPAWVRMQQWPTTGELSSPFGQRWGRAHEGIDIANRANTPIVAALGGTVKFVGFYGGYGLLVRIDHGAGLETRYGHLSSADAVVGQVVAAGSPVGRMGSTGNSTGVHLHFEVRVGGRAFNPIPALPPR